MHYRQELESRGRPTVNGYAFAFAASLTFDLKIQPVHLCPKLYIGCKFGEIPTSGL